MSARETATPAPGRRGAGHKLLDRGALAVAVIVALMVAPAVAWVGLEARRPPAGFELLMLAAAALLTLLIALIQILIHIHTLGGTTIRGNRDHYPVVSGLAARLVRAHGNAVESLVPFAILLLVAQSLSISNRWTAAASALFLAARVVHFITYAAGVTIVRSAAFYAGVIAVVLIALQLPWPSVFHWTVVRAA